MKSTRTRPVAAARNSHCNRVVTERRRYLVLDGFVPRLPERDWVQPGHCYQGEEASPTLLHGATPWVRLIHPTEPDTTALVLKHLVAELLPEDTHA